MSLEVWYWTPRHYLLAKNHCKQYKKMQILVPYQNYLPKGQLHVCEDKYSFGWCNNCESSVKYFFMQIDARLFSPKKMRRITSLSKETIHTTNFSMARSDLEYCCSVWNPHHKEQIKKLEMVQRRAARYITH